jgi:nucleotide-binding universal stress UspA family protein
MSIKEIFVHVDASPGGIARLLFAARLARRFGAFLSGGFVRSSLDMPALADSGAGAVALSVYAATSKEEEAALAERFRSILQSDGLDGAWRSAEGPAAPRVAGWARSADLVLVGQHDPERPAALETSEDVILACGRPVLVVPYAGRFEKIGDRVLMAWNGSREAARAVHDAIPLMASESAVTILSIDPGGEEEKALADALVQHLARHGLDVRLELRESRDRAAADVVMARAAELGVDFLVMGAYGHSKLRETVLGGVTRAVLRRMTVPTLMAH